MKQCNLGIDWAITMPCRSFQKEAKLISYRVTWKCSFSLSWSIHWCLCIWGWGSSGCCRFIVTLQRWHGKVSKATRCGPMAAMEVSSCYNQPIWCRISILHKFTGRKSSRETLAFFPVCLSMPWILPGVASVSPEKFPQPKKWLFCYSITR